MYRIEASYAVDDLSVIDLIQVRTVTDAPAVDAPLVSNAAPVAFESWVN